MQFLVLHRLRNLRKMRLAFTVTNQTLIPLGDASTFATGPLPAGALVVEVDAALDSATRVLTLRLSAVTPLAAWSLVDIH